MARSHAVVALALCAGLWACARAGAGAGVALAQPATTQSTEQALQDAREKLRQEILATEVEPGKTVGTLLRERGLEEELNRQLEQAKPVGGTRWLDERSCQVRLELPGEQVAQILAKTSAGHPTTAESAGISKGEGAGVSAGGGAGAGQIIGRTQLATETVSRMTFMSIGRSGGHATRPPTRVYTEAERKLIPLQPPDWVNRSVSAEAWSRAAKSPLMAAQAAEADARKLLAERVGALTLAYSTTIQHAGEIDPAIAEATARALNTARVRRTDYGPDGSAKVRVEINLRTLWDELNR